MKEVSSLRAEMAERCKVHLTKIMDSTRFFRANGDRFHGRSVLTRWKEGNELRSGLGWRGHTVDRGCSGGALSTLWCQRSRTERDCAQLGRIRRAC
jgi:hypothetical protein